MYWPASGRPWGVGRAQTTINAASAASKPQGLTSVAPGAEAAGDGEADTMSTATG